MKIKLYLCFKKALIIIIIFLIIGYIFSCEDQNKIGFTIDKIKLGEWILEKHYINEISIFSLEKPPYLIIFNFKDENLLLIRQDKNKNNIFEDNEVKEKNIKILYKGNDETLKEWENSGLIIIESEVYVATLYENYFKHKLKLYRTDENDNKTEIYLRRR